MLESFYLDFYLFVFDLLPKDGFLWISPSVFPFSPLFSIVDICNNINVLIKKYLCRLKIANQQVESYKLEILGIAQKLGDASITGETLTLDILIEEPKPHMVGDVKMCDSQDLNMLLSRLHISRLEKGIQAKTNSNLKELTSNQEIQVFYRNLVLRLHHLQSIQSSQRSEIERLHAVIEDLSKKLQIVSMKKIKSKKAFTTFNTK